MDNDKTALDYGEPAVETEDDYNGYEADSEDMVKQEAWRLASRYAGLNPYGV